MIIRAIGYGIAMGIGYSIFGGWTTDTFVFMFGGIIGTLLMHLAMENRELKKQKKCEPAMWGCLHQGMPYHDDKDCEYK